jgi:copper transport protein
MRRTPPTRPRRGRRWMVRLGCTAVIVAWLLLTPQPAHAHAVLVSSNPPAGATLGATPAAVVLRFDEPLVIKLSHATVVDPTGRRFHDSTSDKTMRVPLATAAPGIYRVEWSTVSQADGHAVTGSMRFGVGVAVTGTPAGRSAGPTTGDLLIGTIRALEYVVLLLACGFAVLRCLGRDIPIRTPAVSVAAALAISGVTVVFAELALATSGLSWRAAGDYLTIGATGWARVARIALEVGLVIFAAVRGRLSLWLLAAILGATAIAGHAADIEPSWIGIALNGGHLAAAAVWAGGIMALALVRVTGGWSTTGRTLLPRFSKVAPWAFLASVGLGAVQAALLLGGPGELFTTGYGRTLLVKAIVIAAMVPLSLLAWRRLRPMVRSEALLAVLVVAAAAMLAAFPLAPREAREAGTAQRDGVSGTSPFPRPGDMTMASNAGTTLVGLSLRPGRPGINQIFAYLMPSPTAQAAVLLSVRGRRSAFTACGPSCWSATVELSGGEPLKVAVPGAMGGTATFAVPKLPALDGAPLAGRATRRMDQLNTYKVSEMLSGIRSAYVYQRPHTMWARTWYGGVPNDRLWVGSQVYERAGPRSPWKKRSTDVPAPVPYFPWDPFKPFVNPTVLGTASLGGAHVRLISFFGGHGNDPEPVWFTLWIDTRTNRVLRSQMWAPSHAMADTYYDFDQPTKIISPR